MTVTREREKQRKRYTIPLPAGFPTREITISLSTPAIEGECALDFQEHVLDEVGNATDHVIASAPTGFAISQDLGKKWNHVIVKGWEWQRTESVHSLGRGEYLLQASRVNPDATEMAINDLLIVDERGEILALRRDQGLNWHGCRAVGTSGETLMYAEYAANERRQLPNRVFRSRDRGRSWEVVFEKSPAEIRHFHFLQPRPDKAGEWWLTSGDKPPECRIWVTKDDGNSWNDLTSDFSEPIAIGSHAFRRNIFRLTDMAWDDYGVLWGTDDRLSGVEGGKPGARVFRSTEDKLDMELIGLGNWHFRNIVDVGDFYLLLSQGPPKGYTDASTPQVYLVPKRPVPGVPNLIHLFDVGVFGKRSTKFSQSRASRAAKNGTFFSYRNPYEIFRGGQRILEWNVSFS